MWHIKCHLIFYYLRPIAKGVFPSMLFCLSVRFICLSLNKTKEERMNGFSWCFKVGHGTSYNRELLAMVRITSCIYILYLSRWVVMVILLCQHHFGKMWMNGHEIFRIVLTWHKISLVTLWGRCVSPCLDLFTLLKLGEWFHQEVHFHYVVYQFMAWVITEIWEQVSKVPLLRWNSISIFLLTHDGWLSVNICFYHWIKQCH